MSARCDECANARATGNGYVCALSNKRKERCYMEERYFKKRPAEEKKTEELKRE